jgi:hypothetical protein
MTDQRVILPDRGVPDRDEPLALLCIPDKVNRENSDIKSKDRRLKPVSDISHPPDKGVLDTLFGFEEEPALEKAVRDLRDLTRIGQLTQIGRHLLHGLRLLLRIFGGLQLEKLDQIFNREGPMGFSFQGPEDEVL